MTAYNTELTGPEGGRQTCDQAILISGNGRSGTTLLGKIIHSMQDVEYVFEPPLLFSLLPLVSSLNEGKFRLLFETYCLEELLLGQVTGRSFNLNRNDDSCIFWTKADSEIHERLSTAWTKTSALEKTKNRRLAIKIPDVTCFLPVLQKLYPGMTMVITHRDVNAVIDSVMKKSWFKDLSLSTGNIIWPSRTKDFTTPVWVDDDDVERWRSWSELERAAYYYIRITRGSDELESAVRVSYERLVGAPHQVVAELAERLDLRFGEKTRELIKTTVARSENPPDWTAGLPKNMRDQIESCVLEPHHDGIERR
jgi:hypothetical protein